MNPQSTQPIGQMQDILDISSIVHTPIPDYIKASLITVASILLVILLIFLLKFIVKKIKNRNNLNELSAFEKASLQLKKLSRSDLIEKKKWTQYYFTLDQILREFLHDALEYDFLDMTYEEIQMDLGNSGLLFSSEQKGKLIDFWGRSQSIKFAKQSAIEDKIGEDFQFIRGIIKDMDEKAKERQEPA